MVARLLNGAVLAPDRIGEGGAALVLRETGAESLEALERQLGALCETASQIIDRALGEREG
jgi:glutamate-ammonia-ligase adenylyltransferase